MAKTGKERKKANIGEEDRRKAMRAPEGAQTVKAPSGDFWNPERGDVLIGVLGATTTVKNKKKEDVDRHTFTVEDTGEVLILPDHWDLTERIKQNGLAPGVRLWIAFEGYEEANVQGGKMARYNMAILPAS